MGLSELNIVTIDGPAGSGKSTVARQVARRLGFTFLDTGAMYRAVALGALGRGILLADLEGLAEFLNQLNLDIRSGDNAMLLFLDGENVTEAIRRPEIGQHASDYSKISLVRDFCTALQRKFGSSGEIVCEGRDMGTVVFPGARWKYFMTASLEERASRRWKELAEQGEKVDFESIKNSLFKRDYQDSNREIAPLKPADDAILIDTTTMTVEEVILRIVGDVEGIAKKKD